MWFRYLSHMRAANDQASLHILHSLVRAFADCTKKKGCKWRLRPNCLYQFMWFRYLSHMPAANDPASLYIYIVSPDNLPVSDKVCYPHSRKVKKQPALTNLDNSTYTLNLTGNQTSVICYHGSQLYLLLQNSPQNDKAAYNNMTNMHQCIVLWKF